MKTWRDQVLDRAVEIAGGGPPEEGDINTAMIQLRSIVPPEELALLQRDLESVEVQEDPWQEEYEEAEARRRRAEDDYYAALERDCEICRNPESECTCPTTEAWEEEDARFSVIFCCSNPPDPEDPWYSSDGHRLLESQIPSVTARMQARHDEVCPCGQPIDVITW